MDKHKSQKGQTLLEIIAVLVIIGVILAAVIPAVSASTDNSRVQNALSTMRAVQSAAVGYYNDNGGSYASISIANLAANSKYLPASLVTANAITNPWNGTTTVAGANASNQYVLTMTNVPPGIQQQLINGLQNTAVSTSTPDGKTTTFSANFS